MSVLEILALPNTILRQKAKLVELKTADWQKLKKLAKDMIATMRKANGIGLAAPQVGESIRLIVVEQSPSPTIVINPVIKSRSWKKEVAQEGCLSIPGQFGLVKRAAKITVEAYTLDGEKIKFEAERLFARVIQHEVDHLNGILFIDRLEKSKWQSGLKL